MRVGTGKGLSAGGQIVRVRDEFEKGVRLQGGIREGRGIRQQKGDLLEPGTIAGMGKRSQLRVTGHDVLDVPDDIVDELGDEAVCSEGFDFRRQEIHLIDDILGVNEAYGRVSRTVDSVQGPAVDQVLQLRLDGRDLADEQGLVLMGDTAFQFIGYRIVERANLRERHLLLMVLRHAACPLSLVAVSELIILLEGARKHPGAVEYDAGLGRGGGPAMEPPLACVSPTILAPHLLFAVFLGCRLTELRTRRTLTVIIHGRTEGAAATRYLHRYRDVARTLATRIDEVERWPIELSDTRHLACRPRASSHLNHAAPYLRPRRNAR
jgi:hypothetical protein